MFYFIYLFKKLHEYIFKKFPEHKDKELNTMLNEYKNLRKRKRSMFFKLWKRRVRNAWKFEKKKWIRRAILWKIVIFIISYLSYNLYLKDVDIQILPLVKVEYI